MQNMLTLTLFTTTHSHGGVDVLIFDSATDAEWFFNDLRERHREYKKRQLELRDKYISEALSEGL